jgi:hypothetical protein
MKINAEQAKAFFAHPSQQIYDLDPEFLPDEGFHYYASGNVCGAFHLGPIPGVYFGHSGVRYPRGLSIVSSAKSILREFWADKKPRAIVGWIDTDNHAALAFNRRIGFESRGEISPGITEQVWRA